jgi:hypothetical protein
MELMRYAIIPAGAVKPGAALLSDTAETRPAAARTLSHKEGNNESGIIFSSKEVNSLGIR